MSSSVIGRNVTAGSSRCAAAGDPSASPGALADAPACSEAMTQRAQMQALPRAKGGTAARSSALKTARAHQQGGSFDVDAAIAHWFASPQSGHEEALGALAAPPPGRCMSRALWRSRRA